MNYIKSLQQHNADLKVQMEEIQQDLQQVISYLKSSKFSWPDDYVSAPEMLRLLRPIENKATTYAETERPTVEWMEPPEEFQS